MSVSISDLKKAGVSSGAYKQLFTAPPNKKLPLIRKLEELLAARFKEVRTRNLDTYRTYWTIDLLHETPFAQVNQTMIHALLSKKLDAKKMLEELDNYGLGEDDLFLKVEVPGVGTKLVPNAPLFKSVVIPLVIAFHTARTASIFEERDTSPHFRFAPLQQTDRNRVACDIWEDIANTIGTWYGYSAYKKLAIGQTLKYGVMFAFPLEEWHYEEQMFNVKVDGKGKLTGDIRVEKEGIRLTMPHPSRMGWDLFHPAPTINTDTGVEWLLHWNVVNYGSVLDNRMYWNRKAIQHSATRWFDTPGAQHYFKEVYPCTMRFPETSSISGGTREDKAALYGEGDRGSAVFLGTQFAKLIPKDWGLSPYPYPVWHRFDMVNDETVIWAEPSAYVPAWFIGYDWDGNAGQHSSLSLELSSWQRDLENIFTQMYLTAKHNLDNIIFYEQHLVNTAHIKELEQLGDDRYRRTQFISFDGLELSKAAGLDVRQAFHQVNFQPKSIAEYQAMMRESLNIMRVVLGFTAQETGGQATHQQSAKEVGETASSTDTRKNFTGSGVDDGFEAWGRQVVTGAKAYLNNDIVAHVSADIKDYETHVKALGFEVKEVGDRRVLVAGKKKNLPLETFARSNIPPTKPGDPEAARAIMSSLSIAFQNEQVFSQIGTKRIIKLLEQAVVLGGGPRNFDLTSQASAAEGQPDAAMLKTLKPVFEALQQAILQTVVEKVVKPIAEQSAQEEQRIAALEAIAKQLQQVFQATGLEAKRLEMDQADLAQKMQLRQMEAEASNQRKQEEHTLNLQIVAAKSGVDLTIKQEKAALDSQLQQAESAVDNAATIVVAEAKKKAASAPKQPKGLI